jgi:hypothetical protein
MVRSYTVEAHWDPEARRWWSDTDLPGLVIETDTLDQFLEVLDDLSPDLLTANVFAGRMPEPVTITVKVVRELGQQAA